MDIYRTGVEEEPSKPKFDLINVERSQRQLMNELAMKRTQIEEMKKELDVAKLKIHELTRALQDSKQATEDYQYKLNLTTKNVRFIEDNLQNKRDSVTKNKLQQESAAVERETLRELLQKSEMQNYDLAQKVSELQAQHSCDLAYQKELMDKDAKIRTKITQLAIAVQKMQAEQSELIKISNYAHTCEELQKSVDFYRQEYYKCRRNYSSMSEKFVIASTALEKFQSLTIDNENIIVNNETQIIINQWEKKLKRFNEKEKIQNEVIDNLTLALKSEKETSIKMCLEKAELEKKNKLLYKENVEIKDNLLNLKKERTETGLQTDVYIKHEVVEILDDK